MSDLNFEWLIYLAAGLLLIGYAIRDELKLRVLIVSSSFVYISYYVALGPLWDAIFTSILMLTVNIFVLSQIVLERTTLRMSDDEKTLFEAFDTLNPGQFRRLLNCAEWRVANHAQGDVLSRAGEPLSSLFFIFDGVALIEKEKQRFGLPRGNFLGEIGFILDRPATATATATQGMRYVTWKAEDLRRLGKKYPSLGNALNALLTRDLAVKLTSSYRPSDAVAAPTNKKAA